MRKLDIQHTSTTQKSWIPLIILTMLSVMVLSILVAFFSKPAIMPSRVGGLAVVVSAAPVVGN